MYIVIEGYASNADCVSLTPLQEHIVHILGDIYCSISNLNKTNQILILVKYFLVTPVCS